VKSTRLIGALLVTGCGIIAGCSSEAEGPEDLSSKRRERAPIVLDEKAVLAPPEVSDSAVVEEGSIALPKTKENESWAAKLQPGDVIAGDRDQSTKDLTTSTNPYGFLRKVKSVTKGDSIVIETEPAQLPDLLEGDLVWGEDQPSIFRNRSLRVEKSGVRTLAEGDDKGKESASGSGKSLFSGSLSQSEGPFVDFKNGQIDLGAEFEAELKIRKWWEIPTGIESAFAKLTLKPTASVDIEIGRRGSASANGTLAKTWEGNNVPIPIAGPIPLTVRFRPEITCSVSLNAEMMVRGRAYLTGRAAAGFTYRDGEISPNNEAPSLSPGFEITGVEGKATLTGDCTIKAVVSLLAFDAVGMEGKIGPYATVTAQLCSFITDDGRTNGGFVVKEEHGIKGDVVGRLQVPGLAKPKLEKTIFDFAPVKEGPHYFLGDEKTCERPPPKDSCAGKQDGVYCSELVEFSAYICKDQQIVGGRQCTSGNKCKSYDAGKDQLVCE